MAFWKGYFPFGVTLYQTRVPFSSRQPLPLRKILFLFFFVSLSLFLSLFSLTCVFRAWHFGWIAKLTCRACGNNNSNLFSTDSLPFRRDFFTRLIVQMRSCKENLLNNGKPTNFIILSSDCLFLFLAIKMIGYLCDCAISNIRYYSRLTLHPCEYTWLFLHSVILFIDEYSQSYLSETYL